MNDSFLDALNVYVLPIAVIIIYTLLSLIYAWITYQYGDNDTIPSWLEANDNAFKPSNIFGAFFSEHRDLLPSNCTASQFKPILKLVNCDVLRMSFYDKPYKKIWINVFVYITCIASGYAFLQILATHLHYHVPIVPAALKITIMVAAVVSVMRVAVGTWPRIKVAWLKMMRVALKMSMMTGHKAHTIVQALHEQMKTDDTLKDLLGDKPEEIQAFIEKLEDAFVSNEVMYQKRNIWSEEHVASFLIKAAKKLRDADVSNNLDYKAIADDAICGLVQDYVNNLPQSKSSFNRSSLWDIVTGVYDNKTMVAKKQQPVSWLFFKLFIDTGATKRIVIVLACVMAVLNISSDVLARSKVKLNTFNGLAVGTSAVVGTLIAYSAFAYIMYVYVYEYLILKKRFGFQDQSGMDKILHEKAAFPKPLVCNMLFGEYAPVPPKQYHTEHDNVVYKLFYQAFGAMSPLQMFTLTTKTYGRDVCLPLLVIGIITYVIVIAYNNMRSTDDSDTDDVELSHTRASETMFKLVLVIVTLFMIAIGVCNPSILRSISTCILFAVVCVVCICPFILKYIVHVKP